MTKTKIISSFVPKSSAHFFHDFALVSLSIVTGALLTFTFLSFSQSFENALPQHKAAEEPAPILKDDSSLENFVQVTVEKNKDDYAFPGQKDISLMKFNLTAPEDGRLQQLSVQVDEFSPSQDLTSLQLYHERDFLGSVPLLNGKSVFQNLNLKLTKNHISYFEIKGKIADEASPGNRVRIGFKEENDLVIQDNDDHTLKIKTELPLWGGAVSVVGQH
jgi:hypothetical protein